MITDYIRCLWRPEKNRSYAIEDRHYESGVIYYNAIRPSLYYVPTIQDAVTRHVETNNPRWWKNGDMFLVFRMGKRPAVIRVIAMFECMDGSLTPRTISDYPDDVRKIMAALTTED